MQAQTNVTVHGTTYLPVERHGKLAEMGVRLVQADLTDEATVGRVLDESAPDHIYHLAAQSFVPDPLSCVPGGRLYKSGDLARYLVDGSIDFLGRVDYQIKIRALNIMQARHTEIKLSSAARSSNSPIFIMRLILR